VRQVPDSAGQLLSLTLSNAVRAFGSSPRAPASAEEAIAASIKISTAMARSNFLQPAYRKDWPSTLGQALVPRLLSPAELQTVLGFEGNVERAKLVDQHKAIYYFDCDMGSALIISVATYLGWDVRLVEVPDHNFVRWHLPNGETVNWDWTAWASLDDASYLADTDVNRLLRQRGTYLRSYQASEARGYYIGLIGSKADSPSAGTALLERAISDGAKDGTTYNNIAWNYVIQEETARTKGSIALMYALTAWSMRPDHGNTLDTVACATSVVGDRPMAMALEDHAARIAESESEREGFLKNKQRIATGLLCQ